VLVFLAGLAPLVAFPQTWHYHSTARIVIAFSPEQRNLALQVLAEVQSEDRQLAERLQFTPTRTITVFLCPTQSSFDRVTGGIIPHWGEAAADPAAWRIFLKAMRLHEGKRVTIKHELVHLLLAELSYPQRLPRWFNEGAAILLSGETQHLEPALISRAMATNSLLTFDDLEAMLVFPREKAGLAYSESYHAVNFLVRRHGLAAIKKIAQALALFPTVEEAFHHACGEELFDFEVAYFDYVRENFRWYFLWDENLWWGVGFFLLFMAAYIVTRLRARKKAAAWEQEERELGEDDEHDQHNDEAKPET
jgi:cbb3-type cytochrome oxidase subunit 3